MEKNTPPKQTKKLKALQNIVAIFKMNSIDFRFLFLYVELLCFKNTLYTCKQPLMMAYERS